MSENRVIGRNNQLPWSLPDEMGYFRRVTRGHPVIMGRRTFESRDCKALPNRRNIVVTSKTKRYPKVETATDIDSAVSLVREDSSGEVFVIGGTKLYEAAFPLADRVYSTVVHAEISGDVTLPLFDLGDFGLVYRKTHEIDANHEYGYTMYLFEKRST